MPPDNLFGDEEMKSLNIDQVKNPAEIPSNSVKPHTILGMSPAGRRRPERRRRSAVRAQRGAEDGADQTKGVGTGCRVHYLGPIRRLRPIHHLHLLRRRLRCHLRRGEEGGDDDRPPEDQGRTDLHRRQRVRLKFTDF